MNYDYFHWKNFYSRKQIEELYNFSLHSKSCQFSDKPAWSEGKKLKDVNEVVAVEWKYLNNFFKKILDEIKVANRENYGLHFYDPLDIDNVLFQTYDKNNEYYWHKDASNNPNEDFKFTVLINTSLNKYKGGEFQLFTNGGELTVEEYSIPGTVIIFKSEIPHRVKKIIEGQRISVVFFLRGIRYI